MPNATAEAMSPFPHRAGAASALVGTLAFAFAAVTSGLIGMMHDGGVLALSLMMTACSLASVLALFVITPRPPAGVS